MKPVSSWNFSAPLPKVDLQRICDEAASTDGPIGVIKVTVRSPEGSYVFVLATGDVAAAGTLHRGVRVPDGILADETSCRRDQDDGGLVTGPYIVPSSEPGIDAILGGRAIVVFSCASVAEADRLVAQLVDRVTVNVEVF